MAVMTTTELIDEVKNRVFLPSSQGVFTDSQVLDYANLEMRDKVYTFVNQHHEEYFIDTLHLDMDIIGTKIRVPERSINTTLRDVCYIDPNNNLFDLPLIQLTDEDQYQLSNTTRPSAYYLIGSYMQLVPYRNIEKFTGGGKLRIRYPFKPNKLVLPSRAGTITSVNGSQITVSSLPTNFVVGTKVDFVTSRNGYEVVDYDCTITAISGNVVTFDAVSNVAEGDYLCMAEESPIVQLPETSRMFLIERIAYRIFASWGKVDQANASLMVQQDMINDLNKGLSNRASEPVKLIRKFGILRSVTRYRRGNLTVAP